MVSRWVACWWSCYQRRTSWCTLEREGDMGWCKRCLIGWWIGSETFLSKLVVKHYDAHDFCERNCYDSMTFQCIDAYTKACGRKAFGHPKKTVVGDKKTNGRMARSRKKHTLDWNGWWVEFARWHVSNLLIAMEVGWFWFKWLIVTVVFEFFALDFLSAFFGCFPGCFFGFEWLCMWSFGFTPLPRSQLLPDVAGFGAQTQLAMTQWLPRRKGRKGKCR